MKNHKTFQSALIMAIMFLIFHISTLAARAIELPSVKAFVTNEKVMGGGASIMYWITNNRKTAMKIPLDWFYDGQKYLEVRGDDGVIAAMPGGPINNVDKKYITVDPGAVRGFKRPAQSAGLSERYH
jgi:hypothetical protein